MTIFSTRYNSGDLRRAGVGSARGKGRTRNNYQINTCQKSHKKGHCSSSTPCSLHGQSVTYSRHDSMAPTPDKWANSAGKPLSTKAFSCKTEGPKCTSHYFSHLLTPSQIDSAFPSSITTTHSIPLPSYAFSPHLFPHPSLLLISNFFGFPLRYIASPFFDLTPAGDSKAAIPGCKKSLDSPCFTTATGSWTGLDGTETFDATPPSPLVLLGILTCLRHR